MDIEVDFGFKFFLHQRDFIAGYPIIHCINYGIEKSRRVIFILSRFVVTGHEFTPVTGGCSHFAALIMHAGSEENTINLC